MSRNSPLVSVIIPAYNAERFLEATLRSVLHQSYSNLEVLVIDDGSTDRTPKIIEAIAQSDPRLIQLSQTNGGVAAARNLGIEHATGEFIAPVDADDIWYPEHIQHQVDCFLKSEDHVGLVYAWSVDIDESGALLGSFRAANIQGNVYGTLVCHNFLGNASASMVRRSCLEQVGGYNSELRAQKAQGCEDWDLYLRIADKFDYRMVPHFSVGYRKLSASMSCDYQQMGRSHHFVMQSIRSRHPDLPEYLFHLSSSNLYVYFAYQSYRNHSYDKTWYWIKQAIQADPLSCWIRPGLYIHGLRLLVHRVFGKERSSTDQTIAAIPSLTTQNIAEKKLAITIMIGVGTLFHWVISAIANPMRTQLPISPKPERSAQ